MTDNPEARLLGADEIPLDMIAELGGTVMETVGEKRSMLRRCDLMAKASRQSMGWRFASMKDRRRSSG